MLYTARDRGPRKWRGSAVWWHVVHCVFPLSDGAAIRRRASLIPSILACQSFSFIALLFSLLKKRFLVIHIFTHPVSRIRINFIHKAN